MEAALRQYYEDWSAHGAPGWWKLWMPKLDEAKERFARLIGARPHEVTVSHSISSALTTIASCFLYADRNAVVCADLDFPTIAYQWLARQREGVEVRFARSRDRIIVPMEAYADVVNEKVELVATSHVLYATGAVQPIREIAELTHGRGGRIVVDGYHSVGVLPVDVKALDVDFYVGGVLKWLLGGPGLTFIYVREDLLDRVTPATTGWFASANQFAFDTLHFEPAATADRFEMGTPSMPTAYTGVAGMDMILEAEPERIYQRIRALTDRIVRRAQVSGFEIVSPEHGAARGGVVTLGLERPDEMVSELKRRGFTVDYRPGLLRISPHFFNTEDDVDGLMDEIEAVRSGA